MIQEITQPSIPRPDMKDDFTSASIPRVQTEWLRQIGPQLDLDVPKVILGQVLLNIIGDDGAYFELLDITPELGSKSKVNILERMDWEITTPETPREIKARLEKLTKTIKSLNLKDEKEYTLARTKWISMRDWVRKEVKKRPDWKKALKYREETNETWLPLWHEFLFGTN